MVRGEPVLHAKARPEQQVNVLLVSALESDCADLRRIFEHTHWNLRCVRSLKEARCAMVTDPAAVVICDQALPDGSWRDFLECCGHSGRSPRVIVTSRLPDEGLWAEVLNSGAFDLLAKPFEATEVYRCVSGAWWQWKYSPPGPALACAAG